MKAVFNGQEISGILAVVPANCSKFDDEVANYSHDPANAAKLKALMGYDEHRLAPAETTTSDLVAFGVEELLRRGALLTEEIDALVLVTETPDYFIPPTSSVLHGRLGLREDAYCVDINQGCNGYIYGLFEALMLLEKGAASTVVLAVGDTLSHRVSPQDRNSYPLIGDAAAITILRNSSGAGSIHLEIGNRGKDHQALIIPAGAFRHPSSADTLNATRDKDGNVRNLEQLVMKGGDVFNFTQTVVPAFIQNLLSFADCSKEDIDYFMLHQPNRFILEKIAQKLGVGNEKVPSNIVGKYGNSSSATIPVAIAENLASKSFPLRLCLCGFGAGLSWGGAVMSVNRLAFCEVVEYP